MDRYRSQSEYDSVESTWPGQSLVDPRIRIHPKLC